MKTGCPVYPTAQGLQLLGFALLVGGMLALGAFTAPLIFKTLPRSEAGALMTQIFRRYDIVLLISIGLIGVGEALKLVVRGVPTLSPLPVVRYLCLVALIGMVLFATLVSGPKMAAFQQKPSNQWSDQERSAFETLHRQAELLYKIELMTGVLLIFLTVFI